MEAFLSELDLAVIVVSWNVRDLLARCLHSVQTSLTGSSLSWQIVVVDNASEDGSPAMVRHVFPEVALIELPENRGFAAANNAALRALVPSVPTAQGTRRPKRESPRYVLLLNSDTEVVGRAIPLLLAYLGSNADVGVVGPQLCFSDGSIQSSRRRFPTVGTLFWESTPLEQLWADNPWVRRYRVHDRPNDVEQESDWLVGACLLVRVEAISRAGLLDEGYFLYFEELEWCWRIRQAGWRVVYLPDARVIHHEGRSSEQVPLQRQLYFGRSKVRYTRQVFGPGWARLLRLFLLVMYAWKGVLEGAKYLLGHRRELRRERLRIYAAILRDRLSVAGSYESNTEGH
jgi:GT2 family glycosyltransferase